MFKKRLNGVDLSTGNVHELPHEADSDFTLGSWESDGGPPPWDVLRSAEDFSELRDPILMIFFSKNI